MKSVELQEALKFAKETCEHMLKRSNHHIPYGLKLLAPVVLHLSERLEKAEKVCEAAEGLYLNELHASSGGVGAATKAFEAAHAEWRSTREGNKP